MKNINTLILWIVAFEAISYVIGMRTQESADTWYDALNKPPGTPPDWVFGVVWPALYALIASTGWLYWQRRREGDGPQRLALFAGYMALNWSWSIAFFGMNAPLAGLIWIALMNILSVALIIKSLRDVRIAAILMTPPTLWTMFAMYLNCGILWLN